MLVGILWTGYLIVILIVSRKIDDFEWYENPFLNLLTVVGLFIMFALTLTHTINAINYPKY